MRLAFSVRAFIWLLLTAVLPLAAVVLAVPLWRNALAQTHPTLIGIAIIGLAIAWAALVSVPMSRSLRADLRAMLALAEHGRRESAESSADHALSGDEQRLSSTLDERNRQLSELAAQANSAPIGDDPNATAAHVVVSTRSVTRDPTWRLAVVDSGMPALLAPGVYGVGDDPGRPGPITDLEQWASVSGPDTPDAATRLDGPWGAFTVVHVASSEELRAILYAPWEGRAVPSTSEINLLTLVGQHAAIALGHSLLYAQVRMQASELERLAGVQADFLRGVTHDLQTPLTAIGALASNLQGEETLPTSAASDLDLISFQAGRMRRMVAQLLTMSGLEAGIIRPRTEVFRSEPLVRRVWQSLRPEERELKLVSTGPDRLVVGDPDRLEQVLWAVLDNAIKYSPPNAPIDVSLSAGVAAGPPDGSQVEVISISDSGTGMDADTLSHAFDQFYRADEARRLVPDGSGIGLYTAAGLVRLMGGEITVDSSIGAGTTIRISLPAEPVDAG